MKKTITFLSLLFAILVFSQMGNQAMNVHMQMVRQQQQMQRQWQFMQFQLQNRNVVTTSSLLAKAQFKAEKLDKKLASQNEKLNELKADNSGKNLEKIENLNKKIEKTKEKLNKQRSLEGAFQAKLKLENEAFEKARQERAEAKKKKAEEKLKKKQEREKQKEDKKTE